MFTFFTIATSTVMYRCFINQNPNCAGTCWSTRTFPSVTTGPHLTEWWWFYLESTETCVATRYRPIWSFCSQSLVAFSYYVFCSVGKFLSEDWHPIFFGPCWLPSGHLRASIYYLRHFYHRRVVHQLFWYSRAIFILFLWILWNDSHHGSIARHFIK